MVRAYLSMRKVSGHRSFLRRRLPLSCRRRRMERPSMCGGASTPAMSRNVGARSMLRTISSTLRDRQIGIRSTGLTQCPCIVVYAPCFLHSAWLHPWSPHQERHTNVELEREGFSLDETKLAEVVTVVGRVDNVRVIQLPHRL